MFVLVCLFDHTLWLVFVTTRVSARSERVGIASVVIVVVDAAVVVVVVVVDVQTERVRLRLSIEYLARLAVDRADRQCERMLSLSSRWRWWQLK